MSDWETFCDESYYHLWRVRRKNERGFNDGYHIHNGDEARALVELLNGLERERDEAQQYVKELYIEIDEILNRNSFLQDALHKAREQYRLSSVCRELRSENERLKRIATWPYDADPFTSPDHDNDETTYQ